jgi:hypothetical protein
MNQNLNELPMIFDLVKGDYVWKPFKSWAGYLASL